MNYYLMKKELNNYDEDKFKKTYIIYLIKFQNGKNIIIIMGIRYL